MPANTQNETMRSSTTTQPGSRRPAISIAVELYHRAHRDGRLVPMHPAVDPGEYLGRTIGPNWHLKRVLAVGGMGAVYVARHRLTERMAALKLLFEGALGDPAAHERFLREVRASARIRHPAIVEVLDAGIDVPTGLHFVAMELLEGADLRSHLDRGRLPEPTTLRVARDVLEALAAAHDAGIVHRDLKPENVFVTTTSAGSRIKLLDFGIARDVAGSTATATATAIGTPLYMAPEQMCSARFATAASDVWSFGVMLYEMLSAKRPFEAESFAGIVLAVATSEPPALPASVSKPLVDVVRRCLERDPAARPRDARAVMHLLDASRLQIAETLDAMGPGRGQGGALALAPTQVLDAPTTSLQPALSATQRMLTAERPQPNAVGAAITPAAAASRGSRDGLGSDAIVATVLITLLIVLFLVGVAGAAWPRWRQHVEEADGPRLECESRCARSRSSCTSACASGDARCFVRCTSGWEMCRGGC